MQFEIGICAYNEEKNLNRLLKFLGKEQFSNELRKIFIVCSGCTDNSEKIVEKYSKFCDKIVLIHEDKRMGKPHAINQILNRIKTPVLIFIAADNLPKRTAIDQLISFFKDLKVGAVNGHPIPFNGFKLNKLIWQLYYDIYMQNKAKMGKLTYLTGEFCAFRPILHSVPLTIINDDAWIGMKLQKLGYKIEYCEKAISEFNSPSNILEYIKQRVRIHKGHEQIRADTLLNNIFREPFSALPSIIRALVKFQMLNLIALLFLEFYCIVKSKFYEKGVTWDKIKTNG